MRRGPSPRVTWKTLLQLPSGGVCACPIFCHMHISPSVCIRSHPGLQHQLVRELIHRGELHAAAHWAAAYSVPLDTLPLNVQFILMNQQTLRLGDDGRERREREPSPTEYLQLPLPLDTVHFVNSTGTLRECQHRLAEVCGPSGYHGLICLLVLLPEGSNNWSGCRVEATNL